MKSSALVIIVVLSTACWQAAAASPRNGIPSNIDLQPINILTPATVRFLKGIPNLFGLCSAIKLIPHGTVIRIKEFLEEVVKEIPDDNLLKFHFNNVIFLIASYESIINYKRELARQFRKSVDDWYSDTDEPTMFRDVSEAVRNPFKEFIGPFDSVTSLLPKPPSRRGMSLTEIPDLFR